MKNERLKSKLDGYEDFELAFLSEYQLSTYMKSTRIEVADYLEERGLTAQKISMLIEETQRKNVPKDGTYCPRCTSKKLRTDKIEDVEGKSKILNSRPIYVNKITCDVCGFILDDPLESKSKRNFLWRWLNRIS